jgi:hypothetical protein
VVYDSPARADIGIRREIWCERIPTTGGKREGSGRKAAKIDLEGLEKVCALHASDEDVASWFGVSLRTLQKRRQQPRFAAAMHRGRTRGRMKGFRTTKRVRYGAKEYLDYLETTLN